MKKYRYYFAAETQNTNNIAFIDLIHKGKRQKMGISPVIGNERVYTLPLHRSYV